MVHLFTSFEWWKTEPHDELVNNGAFCLAETGRLYLVYLPRGGDFIVRLEPGRYWAKWFNPRNGEYSTAGIAEGATWHSPLASDNEDWVLLLTRTQVDR
jgi:Putative collagen-binding domain of a collagenase